MKIAIFGQGSFGRFIETWVPSKVEILRYDVLPDPDQVKFEAAARADIIILAVPLESYPSLLPRLADAIDETTLIVDVCSVKLLPSTYFETYMPKHGNLLLTHPLFGPQSAQQSLTGHRLIITESRGETARQLVDYCQKTMLLDVVHMTADEHDQMMAQVHALTFFTARGLSSMPLNDNAYSTPSYSMILDLIRFDKSHSNELFETIQLGNPYAANIRQSLIKTLQKIDTELSEQETFIDE